MNKPFSQACENNKQPILDVLLRHFSQGDGAAVDRVLEIGSGTGQHAVFFAANMPWLRWQPSDRAEHLDGIRAWCLDAALPNLLHPIELDAAQQSWSVPAVPAIFTANTLHIMGWAEVTACIEGVGSRLLPEGLFCVYGPFNYGGEFTSPSNAQFDVWLKQRDPRSGIRDFEAIAALAADAGLELLADHAMPANNRTLVWRKRR